MLRLLRQSAPRKDQWEVMVRATAIRVIRPFAPFVLKGLANIQMFNISNAKVTNKRIARMHNHLNDCHRSENPYPLREILKFFAHEAQQRCDGVI